MLNKEHQVPATIRFWDREIERLPREMQVDRLMWQIDVLRSLSRHVIALPAEEEARLSFLEQSLRDCDGGGRALSTSALLQVRAVCRDLFRWFSLAAENLGTEAGFPQSVPRH